MPATDAHLRRHLVSLLLYLPRSWQVVPLTA
jgi:hypothetical protein